MSFVALILVAAGFIWFISGLDSRQVGSLLTTVGVVMYVVVLVIRRRRLKWRPPQDPPAVLLKNRVSDRPVEASVSNASRYAMVRCEPCNPTTLDEPLLTCRSVTVVDRSGNLDHRYLLAGAWCCHQHARGTTCPAVQVHPLDRRIDGVPTRSGRPREDPAQQWKAGHPVRRSPGLRPRHRGLSAQTPLRSGHQREERIRSVNWLDRYSNATPAIDASCDEAQLPVSRPPGHVCVPRLRERRRGRSTTRFTPSYGNPTG